MKITLLKASAKTSSNQTFVLFQNKTGDAKKFSAKGLSKELQSLVEGAFTEGAVTGELGETRLFRSANVEGYKNVLVVGLGAASGVDAERLRRAASFAFRKLKDSKIASAVFGLDGLLKSYKNLGEAGKALVEGLRMTEYDFDDYKTKPEGKSFPEEIFFQAGKLNAAQLQKGMDEGEITAEAVNFARWLGDTPGNLMTPTILGETARKKAQGTKVKVTLWDKARVKKERMGGLYGVALGSEEEPRFIIMEYKGAPASKKPIVLVGKGLTFDSGGISIKPSQAMDEMKYDMCGGAAVIASIIGIAKMKLKVNVIGLVPSSENMPGPHANKPGDILRARNGKTVEVLNTDAEGRLILMDALSYASELKPEVILDTATLTGAIVVALGNLHSGVFTRDSKLMGRIQQAADSAGDLIWRMPLNDEHLTDMKGTHADLSNISNFKGAGASTAAAFLEQFVEQGIPWAHLDIAGTAWNTSNRVPYVPKKGASGSIVRTFIEFARQQGR
jgi:leucyl aminopeptidase